MFQVLMILIYIKNVYMNTQINIHIYIQYWKKQRKYKLLVLHQENIGAFKFAYDY